MHIIGSLARMITTRLSHKKAYWIYCRIPPYFRDFDTIIDYRGVKLKIFTGETNGKILYYFDAYEPRQLDFLMHFLKPGMKFFDVGANMGIYTLLAARQGADVVSFEPSPKIIEILNENIDLNRNIADKITVVEEAVSNSAGFTDFFVHRTGNIGVGRIFKFGDPEHAPVDSISVPMNTLDYYAGKFGKPDVIKIDIEGAEAFALRGGNNLFTRKDAPILMIEFHPDELLQCGSSVDALLNVLHDFGYVGKKTTPIKTQNPDWYVFYKNPVHEQRISAF